MKTLHQNEIRDLFFNIEYQYLPKKLFVYGSNIKLLESIPYNGMAIVGSREASLRAQKIVFDTVRGLKNNNLIIVSGFARGIDTAAHLAAIENKIPTIAYLGCGMNINYPKQNFELKEKILNTGGLIITEYPENTPAHAHHFLKRNRLIAASSRAIWVVQARFKSGALNTASWGRIFDRDCYTTSCYPGETAFEGNQKLLEQCQAHPFWGIQSLGSTWLELSTQSNT